MPAWPVAIYNYLKIIAMAYESMLDILAALPLFQGVTREKMAKIVGITRFHFLKYADGDIITNAGDQCNHVTFIISGKVRITFGSSDDRLRIHQSLVAPDVISPDFLFGSSTVYPGDVVALGDVGIVRLSKSEYLKVLHSDPIFMFNFLNHLSRNAQKSVEGVLAMTNGSIEERLAMWVVAVTQPSAVDIQIQCKNRDLYMMLGVQRASLIGALDCMVAMGVITYTPTEINVIDRRAMLEIMRKEYE